MFTMFRVRRDPSWLIPVLLIGALWGLVSDSGGRSFYLLLLGGVVVLVVLRVVSWAVRRIVGSPVPDSAVRELIDRCTGRDQYEEWVLVTFCPGVSLEDARAKVGSATYSEQDRLQGFMGKAQLILPSRPDVAVLYSPNKGFLLGRGGMVRGLEGKYGRWMLDTWHSFTGAMSREGATACDLDAPQLLVRGRHIGATEPGG